MRYAITSANRRGFIRLATSLAGGALVSACGGGGGSAGSSSPVAKAAEPIPVPPAATPNAASAVNLALNLGYVGAQFYGIAAVGAGLLDAQTDGVGRRGDATGARQITFSDPMVARHAAELAADKSAHVATLRTLLGPVAAAQPAIDLSAEPGGAFSVAAQRAGVVSAGMAFDPYADDAHFLLGAFLIEDRVAAAYRTLLVQASDEASATVLAANLSDSIFHGGLIRALLADHAADDADIDTAMTHTSALLASLDGTNIGDRTLAAATGPGLDVIDDDGRPIPFTRDASQVLKTLYLSTTGVGGFLPIGANGMSA